MKPLLFLAGWLLTTASAFSQGTVIFVNRIPGLMEEARVFRYGEGGEPTPVDSRYVAQLYAAAPGGTLRAVGDPIPFRSGSDEQKGFWVAEGRTIPGVPENGTAQVKVVAWLSSLAPTYEAAVAANAGEWGESGQFLVQTGGGLTPPQPLLGLKGFFINSLIPEPSSAALGLLGAGIVTLVRRRQRSK